MIAGCRELAGLTGHDAGRWLLAELYRLETGLPLPDIAITSRGKPYFVNSAYHFSITHTPRHAFCILAKSPVGIDAEERDRAVRFSLAERIFSPEEYAAFAQDSDPQRAFLSLWVLKEATAKYTGKGLQGFPNLTHFSPDDPRVHPWANCLVAIIGQDSEEEIVFYDF